MSSVLCLPINCFHSSSQSPLSKASFQQTIKTRTCNSSFCWSPLSSSVLARTRGTTNPKSAAQDAGTASAVDAYAHRSEKVETEGDKSNGCSGPKSLLHIRRPATPERVLPVKGTRVILSLHGLFRPWLLRVHYASAFSLQRPIKQTEITLEFQHFPRNISSPLHLL